MRKRIAIIITFMLAALLLAGCQSSKDNELSFKDTTVQGTVTAVEGEEITVSLGGMGGGMSMPEGMGEGEMPDFEDGEMPDEALKPEGGDKEPGDEEREMPSGNGGGFGMTAVLKISDGSVIESGSLSDISAGTSLCITFDEDGNITSISMVIQNAESA